MSFSVINEMKYDRLPLLYCYLLKGTDVKYKFTF